MSDPKLIAMGEALRMLPVPLTRSSIIRWHREHPGLGRKIGGRTYFYHAAIKAIAAGASLVDAANLEKDGWRPGKTAPKDGSTILVFGKPTDLVMDGITLVCFGQPLVHTAAWDAIDGRFCVTGGSWLGPFVDPTHWMPLPAAPRPTDRRGA